MEKIKCYDTLSGSYVEVEVTDDIALYIRRSYWREEMAERRYAARIGWR